MLIIPELETVVILVPRTGSSTLRRAVLAKYPDSFMLYRHMEADGVPAGYDRWMRVGVVRHPVDRLWSLYKFMRNGLNGIQARRDPSWLMTMRRSASCSFETWLLHNQEVFTSPYDYSHGLRYWPQQTVLHALPENRKSQFVYLRPDLGTRIFRYTDLHLLAALLNLHLTEHHNQTAFEEMPPLSAVAQEYVEHVFAWDLGAML
jgi:hypothetical protein